MADGTPDLAALGTYLSERLDHAADLEHLGMGDGYSNDTLFVRWGDRDLVVRRPPVDETAETAHDVLREYRILSALEETAVPVPPTLLACEDPSVLGAPFYVMERLDGEVLSTEEPDRFATPERRRRLADSFVDTLATVHGVDYEAVGLGDLGRPTGYLERQVEVFTDSMAWAAETTARERSVPELREVATWLRDNCPTEAAHALVHGDYKLDNVLFGWGDLPEVTGVFDWELSTLGDPLADLAYTLVFWPDADDSSGGGPGAVVVEERFAPGFLAHPDYPTRRQFVERYERQTGLAFENRRFYLGLAAFKWAVVGEMFYARYLRGGADEPMYRSMGEHVPAKARRALAIVEGEWTV